MSYSITDDKTHIQRDDNLLSIVISLPNLSLLSCVAKKICDRIISSPIDLKDGIHITVDKPYGRNPKMNVYQPTVLRQYLGCDVDSKTTINGYTNRFTYGTGTGSTTLGIDATNFKTRPFTPEITLMSSLLHDFISVNRKRLNLDTVHLGDSFNHCTILLYYAGDGLKKESLLSPHCDCTYSVHNGKYMPTANSQVENTPTVVYSLGSVRDLNFRRRRIIKGKKGNKWLYDTEWGATYQLSSNSISIIHPDDENPDPIFQYQHGGVKVGKGQLSIGLAFRIVNSIEEYDVNDIRTYDTSSKHADYSKVYARFMKNNREFHENLISLMNMTID